MKTMQYGKLVATGLLLALGSSPAFANMCYQPSPLEIELGEDYWDVEIAIEKANRSISSDTNTTSLASNKNASAFAVLDMFDTRDYTTAQGTRHECMGTGENNRIAVFESNIELNNHTRSSHEKTEKGQRLEFIELSESKKEEKEVIRTIIVDLPVAKNWRLESDDSISTTQINRRTNAAGFSMYHHIDTELKRTAQGIQLSRTIYANGHRASWSTWTLVK